MSMSPQAHYIKCKNLTEEYRMAYYAWGIQEQSQKTLICLHGLNRNGRDWDYIARYFANNGYYVVAPDIVGRGNSDYLTDPKGYDMPFYVADVLKLISVLKLTNVSIIGTSMGGLIGMAIAAMPESPLKMLVLNDIGAEIEAAGMSNIISYTVTQPIFDDFASARNYIIENSRGFGNLPDHIWEFIACNSLQKNSDGKFELKRDINLSNLFVSQSSDVKNIELWEYWDKVNIPTLVIRGEYSKILSSATIDRMKSINSLTQSIEIIDAGHAPFLYLDSQAEMLTKFLTY